MNQNSKQDRKGPNGDRGSVDKSKSKSTDTAPSSRNMHFNNENDTRKACQTKNTDLEGMVTKATKENVWILVQEHYRMGHNKLYGPEPAVVKYKVDGYIRENFPTRTMLEGGTKVIVTTDFFHPMLCKEGCLRLAKAALKEKSTEVKTADSENGDPKKPKKKSSKSPAERLVRNVAAKVIEVSAMDVVLCFQPEGNGEKEPIRLTNDQEIDLERGGKTEILKIEDVKKYFSVGESLKMNAKKKNDVWHVQNLIWPHNHKFHEKDETKKSCENKEAKETCQDLINLTPETEKSEPEVQDSVDTVDNVDRLRQETADLLRKTGLSDLENESSLAHAIAEEIDDSPAKKIVKSSDDKKKLDTFDRKILAAQNDRSPLATLVEEPAEHTVTEDQKGYEIVDFDEDAVRVFTAKEPWAAGMFCRSIWQEDGIEYEGLIKSIEIGQDDYPYAVVQFIGYGNEDAVWLQDLMDSNGEAEREYQSKCVQVLDDQASSTNVDHEEVISLQETATNESIVEINDNEDLKQGASTVITDEKKAKNPLKKTQGPWEAGMFCRSIWKSNGLEYEGLIKSIDMLDDQRYAFVQYLGYEGEEIVWFHDLMESKGEAARENQTNCAKVLNVVNRLKGEAAQENQKIVKLVDDPAPSTEDTKGSLPSVKVDHEKVTSLQEAHTNESIVEIDENEDAKGQLVDAKGASTPPGFVAKMVKNIDEKENSFQDVLQEDDILNNNNNPSEEIVEVLQKSKNAIKSLNPNSPQFVPIPFITEPLPVGAQASFPVPSKEEPVILSKPESFKSKGCEECSGFIKFTADQLKNYTVSVTETALKKMKAAQDAAQDDITKEVWNDLSRKFSLDSQFSGIKSTLV